MDADLASTRSRGCAAQADRMTVRAELMREFADAASPLYASLSDDQKRRAFLLINRSHGDIMGLGDGRPRPGLGRRGAVIGMAMMFDWRG